MKLTPKQFAQALYDSIQETNPKDHDKVMDNFVKILAQSGNLGKYDQIALEYKRLEQQAKGIQEVEVTFAQEHNEKILNDLNKVINGKAEYKTKIDEGLVGGVVVKVDDTLIDASIRTQLDNLNSELKS